MKLKIKILIGLAVLAVGMSTVAKSSAASVLAKVGAREITDQDVRDELPKIEGEQKKAVNADPSTLRMLVDNVVNGELVYQEGVKEGIDKAADFKKAIEKFKRQYVAQKVVEKRVDGKLSKAEIKKYFEKNKNMFDDTQVCASHIVVQDEATAKSVFDQVSKDKSKFAEVAKKKSVDPTVQDNAGDLGCFTREKMVPEFTNVAFNTPKGQIKGPFRTMYGWHVMIVSDIKAGKIPGYEEVEQRAKEAYRMRLMQEMVSDLRNKSKVEMNEAAIKTFKI